MDGRAGWRSGRARALALEHAALAEGDGLGGHLEVDLLALLAAEVHEAVGDEPIENSYYVTFNHSKLAKPLLIAAPLSPPGPQDGPDPVRHGLPRLPGLDLRAALHAPPARPPLAPSQVVDNLPRYS